MTASEAGARSGRLLAMLLVLQSRRRASARELARHLGVSMRTVYRDVEALTGAGVPIYAEPGRTGGYRLVDGYRTTLTGLTQQESLAMFLIGMPAAAASLGLDAEALSVETKMLASLDATHREHANRLRDRFLLDLPAWYQDVESPPVLRELADAVLSSRQVRIRYWRWREPREVQRVLDPHGLVVKNGTWYLVAAARSAMRVYRVSNVLDLQLRDTPFDRRAGFELAPFWRNHLDEFDRRRVTDRARIRVAPTLVTRLPDLGDHALGAAVAAGSTDSDGWCLVELPIESPGNAAGHLIRYGDEIEVLEPPALRTELAALARAVLTRYG